MQSKRTTASLNLHRVSLDDKSLFERYIGASEEQNCDLCFANIFAWSDTYHSEVGEAEGFLVIRFDIDGLKSYMQPIGNGDKRAIVEILRHDATSQHSPLRLYGLSQEWCKFLEEQYPSEFAFNAPRALADYIYRTEDLAQLRGRKYQPKRNHLNHFIARHDWYVEPISQENIKDCFALNDLWLQNREVGEIELAEQRALHRALENFDSLALQGLILYADGKPAAFSYGTAITSKTFCTHIEKYDSTIEGAATMINREMAKILEGEYEFINREDDLGLEGLRFAKMSYNPTLLLEKISALHLTDEQRQMREMWHNIFGDEYEEIDEFLINHSDATPFIHKEGDEVVSMLYVVPLQMWDKRVAYIYAVATKSEYRGRGIASKLLEEAMQFICIGGKFDIAALIPSSTESKQLYERVGFEDTQTPMPFPATDYLGTGSTPHDLAMTQKIK